MDEKQKIQVSVVTPDRAPIKFDDVDEVIVPGMSGDFSVLPEHTPTLSLLRTGSLYIRQGNQKSILALSEGVVEVRNDQVSILSKAAEHPEEIDANRAEQARKRAEQRLESKDPGINVRRAEAALERAMTRLQVASFHQPIK